MSRLSGLRVLVTRPADQAQETAEAILKEGGTALVYPCLELLPPTDPAPLDAALRDLGAFSVVVLTSANAARAVVEQLGVHPPLVAAVGERTAAVLRQRQVPVAVVASEGGEGLGRALVERLGPEGLRGRRVLFPIAAEGRTELSCLLRDQGAVVSVVAAYRMAPPPPGRLSGAVEALRAGQVDLVPLGSPRTAEILMGALGDDARVLLGRTLLGAIGRTTQEALVRGGIRVDLVAQTATFAALVDGLAGLFHRQKEK